MKKILLLIVAVLFATALFAENVNQNKAKQVAKAFAAQRDRNAAQLKTDIVYSHPMPNKRDAAFYVVNLGDTGFVIVSANDVAHPVIGYSFDSPWPTEGNIPPQITDYLDDLAGQIEAAYQNQPDQATKTEWQELLSINPNNSPQPKDNRTQVGPLLTTTWDQGQYYNNMTPETGSGHAVTGCVATAMAQIINYHEYPASGRGTHSYQSNYGELSVNFANSIYDYTNMPDALTNESSEAQINAVAKLMSDCGVAVNMEYTSGESGAFDMDARAALINFFRYSPDASFAEKAFFTTEEWNTMLQTELNASRPVYYSGRGTGGHAFVCDGYNSDGYYHFNFGWSGAGNDTWYLLNAVEPLGMNFNSSQSAILGIAPDPNGNVILGQMQGTSTFIVDEPLEFYHLMGHNQYEGNNYTNPCNNTVTFISADNESPLVVDIMKFDNQTVSIYDGNTTNTLLRTIAGGSGDLNPVVSTETAVSLVYSGYLFYDGFRLSVSQINSCRMVSNVLANVENNSVNIQWVENGVANTWKIEYGLKGFVLGEGTSHIVNTPAFYVDGLVSFNEYDFYIWPICDNEVSAPYNIITVRIRAPYWHNIVTEQPEEYTVVDDVVEISSAEELAWWANNDWNRSVILKNDIDLGGYLWKPIQQFYNHFDGCGHVIKNMRIEEYTQDIGFISELRGVVENLGMLNCCVDGTYRMGILCGLQRGEVYNCYVIGGYVKGDDEAGGLIGNTYYGTTINCFANTDVTGYINGVFVGKSETESLIQNCYGYGTMNCSFGWTGSVSAYAHAGEINHCYGVENHAGVVGYKGSTIISDTASMHYDVQTSQWMLNNPIQFENVSDSDLISVLNRGVAMQNSERLKVWIPDTENINNGLPILGDFYHVECPNVSGLSMRNAIMNDENCVILEWDDTICSQWDIRYYRYDLDVHQAVIIPATSNPDTIYGIPMEYVYNFNVRARLDNGTTSGWGATIQNVVDIPLWTDVVTECPPGFIEDENGNVTITTAEGLAWLSVLTNNGNEFSDKLVQLANDIDLTAYRWSPIGSCDKFNKYYRWFSGVFDGGNHTINGIYVNCHEIKYAGLFGNCEYATLKNLNVKGRKIKNTCSYNPDDVNTGGVVGRAYYTDLHNCHSSLDVYGIANVGSLCGYVRADNTNHVIRNCSATGNVEGRESSGGLAGFLYGDITISNSYATGNVSMIESGVMPWYVGGLVGNFMMAKAYNCYSTGSVDINTSLSGKVIGCPYIDTSIHYLYGEEDSQWNYLIGYDCEDMSNTSFFRMENSGWTLTTPVSIKNQQYSSFIDALNAWVINENDQNLKTWVLDSETGYPVFGDYFEPSCYNPTNLIASNATVVGDPTILTQLSWEQIGNPDHWEILYVAANHQINEGVIVSVENNPCVLSNIPTGQPLDFYVRAICGDEDLSNWSAPYTYIPDKLYWNDVVTSQPEGYSEDSNGNVYISSAEGLAWLSKVTLENKIITLTNDIDISEYRWNAMMLLKSCTFDGTCHIISGLYCNDLSDSQGLFGAISNCTIKNLVVSQCNVYGMSYVGGIVGYAQSVDIINCSVEGNVYGTDFIGGIAGVHNGDNSFIINSSYKGDVAVRTDITKISAIPGYIGGICGSPMESSIINCYVVSDIAYEFACPGIITGTGSMPHLVSNCYYKKYNISLPITDNCTTSNNSSFSGSGTTWTLNTPPYVNGAFRTDLLDALNAWVDANNANGEYLHWVADTENQNGGFPMLEQEYQIQQLASGWNWYSTYIEQNDADGLSMLESGLGSHGELIMSRTGAMVENFEGTFWWGDLNAVTNEEMYEIKTNAQTNVVLTGGKATPSSHPITVAPGWNWIGYVSNTSTSIDNALSSLTSNEDDIIQSRNAFSSYFPGYGWYGDLENMTPGQGYMYKSNGTVSQTLVYPTASRSNESEAVAYHNQADYNRYRNVMDVMAKVIINGEPANSNRYELAAFVDGECRGRAKLQYVEPIETYLAFITINGNDDETVTFNLYDEDMDVTYYASEANVVAFKANEVVGKFRTPYILCFNNAENVENTVFTVYPNPAANGEEITISFMEDVTEATLFVENELGLTVDVVKLSGKSAKVRLDLPSCLYILRVVIDGNIYYNKLIVK